MLIVMYELEYYRYTINFRCGIETPNKVMLSKRVGKQPKIRKLDFCWTSQMRRENPMSIHLKWGAVFWFDIYDLWKYWIVKEAVINSFRFFELLCESSENNLRSWALDLVESGSLFWNLNVIRSLWNRKEAWLKEIEGGKSWFRGKVAQKWGSKISLRDLLW